MQYVPKLPDENVNVSKQSAAKEFVVLLTGLMGIIIGVYFVLGLAVDWAVERMDPEMEQRVFGNFDFEMEEGEDYDKTQSAYLQKMVDEINANCTHLPVKFKVYAVPDEMVNAVALPGGGIMVFGGLLDIMESENALAMVLGHELGHFNNRDHLKGIGRALVLLVLSTIVLGPDNMVSDWLGASFDLSASAHSRGQESKADTFGLKALNCRYGHVSGATQFFEFVAEEHKLNTLSQYFSTHPAGDERVDALNAQAISAGYGQGILTPMPEILKSKKDR